MNKATKVAGQEIIKRVKVMHGMVGEVAPQIDTLVIEGYLEQGVGLISALNAVEEGLINILEQLRLVATGKPDEYPDDIKAVISAIAKLDDMDNLSRVAASDQIEAMLVEKLQGLVDGDHSPIDVSRLPRI